MELTKEFVMSCRSIGFLRDILCQAMDRIDAMESENKWHRCDIPNDDGLYDFPPEPGDYIVEFVSNENPIMDNDPCVMQSTFDPDYNDWNPEPFDCHARQWREMPKAPEAK